MNRNIFLAVAVLMLGLSFARPPIDDPLMDSKFSQYSCMDTAAKRLLINAEGFCNSPDMGEWTDMLEHWERELLIIALSGNDCRGNQCVRQVRSQFMGVARSNSGAMRNALSAYMFAAKSAMLECGEPREDVLNYWRQYSQDFSSCIGPRR